jgi:hypothetical protein
MTDPLSIIGGVSAITALAEQLGKVVGTAINVYEQYKNPELSNNQFAQVKQVSVIASLGNICHRDGKHRHSLMNVGIGYRYRCPYTGKQDSAYFDCRKGLEKLSR